MIYYLYIKTHNKTKLKYLGYTKQNPYSYLGSGGEWLKHLKQHGNDISTDLLGAFDTKEDASFAGRFWSKELGVVESKEYLNQIPETGGGPGFSELNKSRKGTGWNSGFNRTGEKMSPDSCRRMSESQKARLQTNPQWNKGKKMTHPQWGFKGRKHSKESIHQFTEKLKQLKWWNNGVQNLRRKECPGPEWKLGRLLSNEHKKRMLKGRGITV